MRKNLEVASGQLEVQSYQAELVPLQDLPDLSPASRINLLSLLGRLGSTTHFGVEPTLLDYARADREFIERGLYVPKVRQRDRRPGSSEKPQSSDDHIIYKDVPFASLLPSVTDDRRYYGVAFQPDEFRAIARSPLDLGRHAVVRTEDARWGHPDRVESNEAAQRSGEHALDNKLEAMNKITARLQNENAVLKHLIAHIYSPNANRMRINRLDAERTLGIERIHDTVEVARLYLGLDNRAIVGVHRVLKRRLYSGNYSSAERGMHLVNYLKMVGMHNFAKLYKIELSRRETSSILESRYRQHPGEKEATERGHAS